MYRKRRKGGPRSSRLGKKSRKSVRTKTKQQKSTRRRRRSRQKTAAERIAQVAATAAAAATFAVGASAASPPGWNYQGGEWTGEGSKQALKKAFRRQSLITHPDKCPPSKKTQCNDEFTAMSNAYDAMITALTEEEGDNMQCTRRQRRRHGCGMQRPTEEQSRQMLKQNGLQMLIPILAAAWLLNGSKKRKRSRRIAY